MFLDDHSLRTMVHGGAVLGAGGGGTIPAGLAAGRRALACGRPRLLDLTDLPDDARLVTFSGVGTVGKTGGVDRLDWHFSRALKAFQKTSAQDVAGIIPSEVGPLAVTYGWQESVLTGIPIVDAPCNGRAHPLGIMGSLNLHRHPHILTRTVAVVGNPRSHDFLELVITANVVRSAQVVRNAVERFGISLAVVRNPVVAAHVRSHAAPGALRYARRVGEVLLQNISGGVSEAVGSLARFMGGCALAQGVVHSSELAERGGFTIGEIVLRLADGGAVRIPVCNEFMMVLRNGSPLAAFPDLITLFDSATCLPLGSAEVRPGQRVTVLGVPRKRPKLGSAMNDRALLRPIAALLRIPFPLKGMSEFTGRQLRTQTSV